jgi:hypothetical protein
MPSSLLGNLISAPFCHIQSPPILTSTWVAIHRSRNCWRQQALLLWRRIAPKIVKGTLAIVNEDDEERYVWKERCGPVVTETKTVDGIIPL